MFAHWGVRPFLAEACNLFAYSIGPLHTGRNTGNLHMAEAGTGTTTPPRMPGNREPGSRRGVEPMTTRLEVLQKMAEAVTLIPTAAGGAVAIGAGSSLGFPGEARAAKGGAVTEVRVFRKRAHTTPI